MWPKQTSVQGTQTLCAATYGQGSISVADSTGIITETTCVLGTVTQETGSTLQVSSQTGTSPTPVTVASGGTLGFTKVASSSVLDIKGNLVMDSNAILTVAVTKTPINALFVRWESTSCTMPPAKQSITGCTDCEILMDKEGGSHCTLRVSTKTVIPSPATITTQVTSSPSASSPVVTAAPTSKSSSSDNKALLGLIALVAIPIIVVIAILIYFGVKSAGSAGASAEEVEIAKLSAPEYAEYPPQYPYDANTPISTPVYV